MKVSDSGFYAINRRRDDRMSTYSKSELIWEEFDLNFNNYVM